MAHGLARTKVFRTPKTIQIKSRPEHAVLHLIRPILLQFRGAISGDWLVFLHYVHHLRLTPLFKCYLQVYETGARHYC